MPDLGRLARAGRQAWIQAELGQFYLAGSPESATALAGGSASWRRGHTSPCAPLTCRRSHGWHPQSSTAPQKRATGQHSAPQRLVAFVGTRQWGPSHHPRECRLDLFTCPHHTGNLRLTPQACAQYWQRARKAEPWDTLRVCRGCEIGAGHAGEPLRHLDDAHRSCCYCGRTGQRLVAKIVCISCFNRLGELRRGRYRRAAPPGLANQLRCFRVVLQEAADGHPCLCDLG